MVIKNYKHWKVKSLLNSLLVLWIIVVEFVVNLTFLSQYDDFKVKFFPYW